MTTLRYGDDKTIHSTEHLDVEVDTLGNVVSVWFRCMPLPFKQHEVGADRGAEMQRMYGDSDVGRRLKAVVVEDYDL